MDSYMHNSVGEEGNDAPKIPVPPLSTPVESYLDKPFLDQTSPRLKTEVPMTGVGHGEAAAPRNFVPVEGAVIPEVLTRQRVIGPKGRDYNAVVSVVIPQLNRFGVNLGDKHVSNIEVANTQAGGIAAMLSDTIAAMAFENDLMVPEDELKKSGIAVSPGDFLGGLGSLDLNGEFQPVGNASFFDEAPSAEEAAGVLHEMSDKFGESYNNPEFLKDMINAALNKLPDGPKKEKVRAKIDGVVEILRRLQEEMSKVIEQAESEVAAEATGPADTFPDDQVPPSVPPTEPSAPPQAT